MVRTVSGVGGVTQAGALLFSQRADGSIDASRGSARKRQPCDQPAKLKCVDNLTQACSAYGAQVRRQTLRNRP